MGLGYCGGGGNCAGSCAGVGCVLLRRRLRKPIFRGHRMVSPSCSHASRNIASLSCIQSAYSPPYMASAQRWQRQSRVVYAGGVLAGQGRAGPPRWRRTFQTIEPQLIQRCHHVIHRYGQLHVVLKDLPQRARGGHQLHTTPSGAPSGYEIVEHGPPSLATSDTHGSSRSSVQLPPSAIP